ncbi:hypothetical protein A1Q1_06710 [Trichosporon asahii var. asahii CBS 2479]|uniref:Uncharacterized protein n=1 Tax=Trichosporon asahii var. asahii (strain ATCC 90039 / CBS 2479 / JCM 2466 / KCTC 7840 / NBRC 103889/ NCYC 2677 / UAMH 7654) TaxID=1186058 RepID=J6F9U6_TRIAS|nr:hypothetical protein A1Q1_06710 [Trichosporon asahii var. asahii CBS 2479]EJT51997.1 hypothetical protein A1Q1_06710 [Trichosporon asahii var. asahii CBS 2479]
MFQAASTSHSSHCSIDDASARIWPQECGGAHPRQALDAQESLSRIARDAARRDNVYTAKHFCFETQTGPLLYRAEPITSSGERTSYYDLQPDAWAKGPWQCERFPTRIRRKLLRAVVNCGLPGAARPRSLSVCVDVAPRTARARARRKQWKLVSVAMFIHCALQLASIIFILRVYTTDPRFNGHDSKSRLGLAARRGEPWAAGRSARRARRHKRTLSGRVVSVPEGTPIPPEQVVTVGEVVAAHQPDEQSPLLAGHGDASAAGGSQVRATAV